MRNDPYQQGNQPPSGPYQPGHFYPPSTSGYPTTDPYPTSAPTYVSQNSYAPPPPPPMYQPAYASVVPPPPKPRNSRGRIFLILGIVVVVLLIAGTAGLFALRASDNGATTPTPTPTPVPYPSVASAYSGSVHNTTFNHDAYMVMTSVTQDNSTINGTIQFGLPLIGSGSFTGTVTRSDTVNFVVTSSDDGGVMLTFSGTIESQGFMSGTYTVNNGQKGTWRATPATAPVLYPLLYQKYAGTYTNNSTHKSGNMTLQIITQNQQNLAGVYDSSLPFDGTVGSDNSIRFTITDAKGISIKFNGQVTIDGSLSGTISTAQSGVTGTWKVIPVQ